MPALMLAAAAIVLSGCTPESAGQAETTQTATQHPTTRPPISRPLDGTRYADRLTICDLFTDEQARTLEVMDDTPEGHSTGNLHRCQRDLSGSPRGSVVVVYTLHVSDDWLGETYRIEADDDEFSPITIYGQPAARFEITMSLGREIGCNVVVGLADRQGLMINVSDFSEQAKACERAVAAAEYMVLNLGG